MKSAGGDTSLIEVEERVMEQAEEIDSLSAAMDRIVQNMDRWERQGVSPAPPPPQPGFPLNAFSPPEPNKIHLSLPTGYNGDTASCQGFLLKLNLYLATVFPVPSDREKSCALVSCLTGKALEWASAVCREEDAALDHFEEFACHFRTVFDHPPEGRAAGERLYHLRQETRSAQEFALEFRTLAAGAGWSDRALIDHYRCSLREDVRRELACRDTTLTFDQLVDMSIRLDNMLATRGRLDRGLVVPSSRTLSPESSSTIYGRRGHTAGRCRVGSSGNREGRKGTLASPQGIGFPHQEWKWRATALQRCVIGRLQPRPGSQNVKADALSRLYDTEERSMDPTPILPASCLVAPVVWELDADIERASRAEPSPPECPAGRLYVPSAVRDRLIYWAHMSPSSGHPGIGRTMRCLDGRYWWPTLAKDVRIYVSSCSVCAQCKAPRHLHRGYQPVLAPWHQSQTEAPAMDNWFRRAEETWEAVHVHFQHAIRRQKVGADRCRSEAPVFAPGDRVWLSTRNLPLRLLCRKLVPRFVGPFKVLRRVNEVCYRLQLLTNYHINPSFHVSLLRPVLAGPLQEAERGRRGRGVDLSSLSH
ncbi:uncharacterized protein ACWYII_039152 [Salvelinus alpinus]